MLTAQEMDVFWANYLGDLVSRPPDLATPARGDLAGLPPAFLTIPECDVLTGQSLAAAERLKAAATPVTAMTYAGASHSFLEAVSIAEVAARALQDGADWLRATLTS